MDYSISYQEKDKDLLYIIDENTGEIDKNKFATKKEIHKKHLWHNEAALFIVNQKGEILLQKRSNNVHFNKGKWGMVAIHPTIHQNNIEALQQKALEEIGVSIKTEDIMFLTLAKRDDEQKNKYAYFYYMKTNIKDKDIQLEPYLATEYKWWSYDELKEKMLTNSSDTVFKNIPFYIYVFKELEKIVSGLNTGKSIKYKEFLISETEDKVQHPCVLYRPKNKTNNIAIFVHGSGGNFFKQKYLTDLTNRITYAGCAFMTTNNRGAEQELNLYKQINDRYEKFKAGNKYEIFDEAYKDIDSYVKLAKEKGFKNIILIGHSLGTLKVLDYARNNKEIDKIILLSPVDMVFRFKARVKDKYDDYINLAKSKIEEGMGLEMLTEEFSAQKIYSTFRYGGKADTLAIEENRKNRILDYYGHIDIIKGTSDHVYGDYSKEYIDEVFAHEFSNAILEIKNIVNADHNYKGFEKQAAALLTDSIVKMLK